MACKHTICGVCGGKKIHTKYIGVVLNDICSGKCQAATKDECSCKCEGKFHKGANKDLINFLLEPASSKAESKTKTKKSIFQPITMYDYLAEFLNGVRIKTSSFDRHSDRNYRKDNKKISLFWLSPTGKNIDTLANDFINETGFTNYDESDIINAIVNYVNDYPAGLKQYIKDVEAERIRENEFYKGDYFADLYDNKPIIFGNMKLKKGSAAAKAYMAKIRAKKTTTKKVGATKSIYKYFIDYMYKGSEQIEKFQRIPKNAILKDNMYYVKNKYGIIYPLLNIKYNTPATIAINPPIKKVGDIALTKKGKPAKRLSKSQKDYNKDVDTYKYFVVKNGKIESGFEFKSDALDLANEFEPKAVVLSKKQLNNYPELKNFISRNKYTLGATKKPMQTRHKDISSHNVNIKVVSGVSKVNGLSIKATPTVMALSKRIAKLTDFNDHTGAIMLLAKYLKDKENIKVLNMVKKSIERTGYLEKEYSDLRNIVYKELLTKAKLKLKGIDFETIKSSF